MCIVVKHELSKPISISRGLEHNFILHDHCMPAATCTEFCHFPVEESVCKVCCSVFVCVV